MLNGNSNSKNLLEKYRPDRLKALKGQPEAVGQLESFSASPTRAVFLFYGPTGVGKTSAAWALAKELGCTVENEELGGVYEIASGQQDGRAVEALLRALTLRPLFGSGWRLAIVNEADRMTDQAETIWLDGLENLPDRTVVIFTTNDISRLSARLIGRCEVVPFQGQGDDFQKGLRALIRKVWKAETGQACRKLPENLGRLELACEDLSIRVALQQVAPYIRQRKALPARFGLPIVHEDNPGSAAANKAWDTRRRKQNGRAHS